MFMTRVILDIQECSRICSFTSHIENGWLINASTGFVEVNSSLCYSIYRSSPAYVFLYFMEILDILDGNNMETEGELVRCVDDSLASAKKANGSLNGVNSMTPLINT